MAGCGALTLLRASEKGMQKENASTSKGQRKCRKSERKRPEKSACADKCEAMGAGAPWGREAQVHHERGIRGERAFIRTRVQLAIKKALRGLKTKEVLDTLIIELPKPLPLGVGERGEVRPSCSCPHRHEPKIPAGPLPAHPRTSARIGYLLPIVCTGKYREWS